MNSSICTSLVSIASIFRWRIERYNPLKSPSKDGGNGDMYGKMGGNGHVLVHKGRKMRCQGRKMRCKRSKMLVYRSQKGMYGSHFAMFMEQKKTVLKHPASKRSFLLRGVLTSLQPSVLLPLVRHSLSYLCQCD